MEKQITMKAIWNKPILLLLILIFVCGAGWLLVLGVVKSTPLFIYAIIQGGLLVRIAKLIADLEHKNYTK